MPAAPVRRITRFTVMATLQAARARRLGLTEDSAYSWGLNRAIFFAAAKRGFHGTGAGGSSSAAPPPAAPEKTLYSLGNDEAYRDPDAPGLLFTIGGETQTPDAFRRQVAVRFGDAVHFDQAWKEAMTIVGEYDEATLRSGREFYDQVYRPRRDALVTKWSEEFLGSTPAPAPRARRVRTAPR